MNIKMTEEQCRMLVHVATIGNMAMIDCSPGWTKEQAQSAEDAIQELIHATS